MSAYSSDLHARGWVANHDGNVSARMGARFLITPTAVSKRLCPPESIVECEASGAPVRGRPPSEVALHVGAYRARPDVSAVLHAHPPYASAFALVGRSLEPIAMPEVVVSIGPRVPVLPRYLPKDPEAAAAVAEALAGADVLLLGGNGVLTVGPDLETAFLRLELVEHYAKILSIARGGVGEPAALSPAELERLVAMRKAAGLHREAAKPVGLRGIVAEEVERVLKGTKR